MLLSCPFCGHLPDRDDPETIHPAVRPEYDPITDKLVYTIWQINCVGIHGGCDASILGDSPEDCIEKWNKRV
jgi:hypothetical protein